MGPSRLVSLLLMGSALLGQPANADLKAVFAFNDRVVSVRFPEFSYRILTTVDEKVRRIAISFPELPLDRDENLSPPHLEISIESMAADVNGQDYYQHYLQRYRETLGTSDLPVEEPKQLSLALDDPHVAFLYFNDGQLRAHKALLITSTNGSMGIVVLLDTLADSYEENENVSNAIVQSIQFEK
jgi:hypothetical protein